MKEPPAPIARRGPPAPIAKVVPKDPPVVKPVVKASASLGEGIGSAQRPAPPLKIQLPTKMAPLVTRKCRYKVLYGGRGGAKSHSIALALLVLGMRTKLKILCCREIQNSIEESVYQVLLSKIEQYNLGGFFKPSKTDIVGANGTRFVFRGLSNETVDSIKSFEGCDICWVEEAQTISARSLSILLPTIRKDDSEVWFSYNPRLESDPVHKRFVIGREPDAWVQYVGIDDNPWASKTMWAECLRDYEVDPQLAAHVWGGLCLPSIDGAIYANELIRLKSEGRMLPIAYETTATTVVSFDLGIGDHTSVIVGQIVGGERRILHAYENSGQAISHYIDWVKAIPGLRIDMIALPHDSAAKSLQTGVSTRAVIKAAWPAATVITVGVDDEGNKIGVEEQISAVRERFSTVWIDSSKCDMLTSALERYRRRFDKANRIFCEPLHDTYSDMADSFRYFMILQPPKSRKKQQKSANVSVTTMYGR